jgi:hypothetical protein
MNFMISNFKSVQLKRIRLMGHVACMWETRDAYIILVMNYHQVRDTSEKQT